VRVVVFDESPLFRRQLIVALERHSDIEVMAEAASSDTAIAITAEMAPDVAFLTMRLPPVGGVRTAISLREAVPGVQIAFIMGTDEDIDLVRAVKAGASGFAPRDAIVEHAGSMARALVAGRPVLTARVAAAVVAEYESLGRHSGSVQQQLAPPHLEQAEMAVLTRMADHRSAGEAAADLGIGTTTAANLARNAMEKLHRHTRTEAVAFAARSTPS
jgi:DNA-binding NarL/FixJ family response regulator